MNYDTLKLSLTLFIIIISAMQSIKADKWDCEFNFLGTYDPKTGNCYLYGEPLDKPGSVLHNERNQPPPFRCCS
jgi:hypothetical protein